MNIENIKIAQALAYQLERVDSDIEMISEDVLIITIRTDDGYSYSLPSLDNLVAANTIKDILMEHLHEVKAKILKGIEGID